MNGTNSTVVNNGGPIVSTTTVIATNDSSNTQQPKNPDSTTMTSNSTSNSNAMMSDEKDSNQKQKSTLTATTSAATTTTSAAATTTAAMSLNGETSAAVVATTTSGVEPDTKIPSETNSIGESAPVPPLLPKPQLLESRIMSASEIMLASKPKSVTAFRKNELLEQARASRLEWIRKAPFPYDSRHHSKRKMASSSSSSDIDDDDIDPLELLRETHAGRQLPTALQVLEHLYGFPERANENAAKHISSILANIQAQNAVPTPEQARRMALDETNDPLLASYHAFVQKLSDPPAAVLVQWMRTFCRSISNEGKQQPQQQEHNQQQPQQQHNQQQQTRETLTRKIQSYAASTYDAIQAHVLWKGQIKDDFTRRAFESFLYGQCRESINAVCWTTEMQNREKAWQERIDALQFVTATHLEVACLEDSDVSTVQTILQAPVNALLSVSSYHAPFEKLQRILAMYHNINAALSKTLNQNRGNGEKKKLPSADDVLPTIILTVLQAKPHRLQYNLQLIEDFCPPEQLRGEAGYAYTNLFSAIQFLSDLNIDMGGDGDKNNNKNNNTQPENLSITAQEFRQGLASCRAAAKQRLAKRQEQQQQQQSAPDAAAEALTSATAAFLDPLSRATAESVITARDIRLARQMGETIDVDWAIRLQKQSQAVSVDFLVADEEEAGAAAGEGAAKASSDEEGLAESVRNGASSAAAGLPSGFRRSYTFLSLQPEDVKVTDLPKLLEEYRMMVHTTEGLLAERQAKLSSEKKEQLVKDEKDLYERVKTVDPSLLANADTATDKKKKKSNTIVAAAPTTSTKK